MLTFSYINFAVCLIFVAIVFAIIGYHIGRGKKEKPIHGGVIDFEAGEDGREKCIFKLEGDIEWIAQQKTIIFEVRKNH